MSTSLQLPPREGPRPRTTPANPHQQLDQNGPVALGDALVAVGQNLADVFVADSAISVPGTRAFWLHAPAANGPEAAFMVGTEFAHLHPGYDGSLHLTLPEDLVEHVVKWGWGELHPLAIRGVLPPTICMIYGPRDESEYAAVSTILRCSHRFARGETPSAT